MNDLIIEVEGMKEIIFMYIEKYVYFYEKRVIEISLLLQLTKKLIKT